MSWEAFKGKVAEYFQANTILKMIIRYNYNKHIHLLKTR
jgi:hypothetical protein